MSLKYEPSAVQVAERRFGCDDALSDPEEVDPEHLVRPDNSQDTRRALPTETNVESGTSKSKRGTSGNLRNSG